jgi:hypothetical protein
MKEYKYKVKGADYKVTINDIEGKIAKVEVNGIPFEVELDRPVKAMPKPVSPVAHPAPAAHAAGLPITIYHGNS